jgi:hypothetical protein
MCIRCRGKPFTEQLPSDSPRIVVMFTGRYQATHFPARDRRKTTVLDVTVCIYIYIYVYDIT